VFPDIDSDDGDVRREHGVLVLGGDDFEALGLFVVGLYGMGMNADSVGVLWRRKRGEWPETRGNERADRRTTHPHPEPWIPAVLALTSFFNPSKPPKSLLTSSSNFPPLTTLDSSEPAGAKFFQNNEWLM
jgi:hypothetical protein